MADPRTVTSTGTAHTSISVPAEPLFDLLPVPVTIIDREGKSRLANRAYETALGLDHDEVRRRALGEAVHPDDLAAIRDAIERSIAIGTAEADGRMLHGDGTYRRMRWTFVRNDVTGLIHVVALETARTWTAPAAAKPRLEIDPITGLLDRTGLIVRAEEALERAPDGLNVGLVHIDLDRFRTVNDSFGHQFGNELISGVARRLEAVLEPAHLVARVGGDEFAVLAPMLVDVSELRRLAGRVRYAFSEGISTMGRIVHLDASIGAAMGSVGSSEVLFEHASTATYRAKDMGRGRTIVFDDEMREEARAFLELEEDLRRGIEAHEFVAFYQPIIDLHNGGALGAEVLARWNHPVRGVVAAGEFVDVAHDSGLLARISNLVRVDAVPTIAHFPFDCASGRACYASINLSADEILDSSTFDRLLAVATRESIPADQIVIEVTERSLLADVEKASAMLDQARAFGTRVAIDDFGTGFSSLRYLIDLPIDIVKVDMSFLQKARTSGRGADMMEALIGLLHTAGVSVVAEGVEYEADVTMLRDMGCDAGQGYFFARPMDGPSLLERLAR